MRNYLQHMYNNTLTISSTTTVTNFLQAYYSSKMYYVRDKITHQRNKPAKLIQCVIPRNRETR